ncbi:His_Phos_1 domain-containing protein [Fagus crenata]
MESSSLESQATQQRHQNVVVMRHGDRMDNFEPLWVTTAARPWDPPLVEAGLVRAFCTGRKIRNQLGFPIHRVFVSPFLRCVQTASQVVSALCALHDDPNNLTADNVAIDPSKIKVSVEYGLCEMLNSQAIRSGLSPKDGKWGFNISELEAILPAGTVDNTVEPVYKELPQWEESVASARARYANIFQALADKYPKENLLLVTHGEGVGVAVSTFLKDTTVYEVDYCAYTELRRSIFEKDQSFTAGNFEVLTHNAKTGIRFTSSPVTDDIDEIL